MNPSWRGVSRQQRKHLGSSRAVSWSRARSNGGLCLRISQVEISGWVFERHSVSDWDSLPVIFFSCLSSPLSLSLFLFLFRSQAWFLSLSLSFSLSRVCTLFFLSLSPPIPFTLMHTCTQHFLPLPCLCYNLQQYLFIPFSLTHTHKYFKSGNIQTWVVSWL